MSIVFGIRAVGRAQVAMSLKIKPASEVSYSPGRLLLVSIRTSSTLINTRRSPRPLLPAHRALGFYELTETLESLPARRASRGGKKMRQKRRLARRRPTRKQPSLGQSRQQKSRNFPDQCHS